ncbi:HNH endonuclease [Calidithermus chliarophilus]|uniref:HNH endonuclease n=1 Tax=Calidithermus chliarophilus TaxID=52023 RepID=UPI0004133A7D|nr:HNH endonuclease [Calidithermus chliarophilus]
MGPKIYYHVVGKANAQRDFPRTLFNQRGIDEVVCHVPEKILREHRIIETLQAKFPSGAFNAWGVPEGARDVVQALSPGDAVFIIESTSPKSRTTVLGVVEAFWPVELYGLSKAFWTESRFPYIFFFSSQPLNLSWEDFRELIGYSSRYRAPALFLRVREDKIASKGGLRALLTALGVNSGTAHPRKSTAWTRDALILVLDQYFRGGVPEDLSHSAISDLHELLRQLLETHGVKPLSPRDVHRKLADFAGLDSSGGPTAFPQPGRVGDAEIELWGDFVGRRGELESIAEAIRSQLQVREKAPGEGELLDEAGEDYQAPEGRLLLATHKRRERNRNLVEAKKQRVLALRGTLQCEVCGFDFQEVYGELGSGFIECHHNVPLASLPGPRENSLEDLALVCSNCHRMLHRSREHTLTVEELRAMLRG